MTLFWGAIRGCWPWHHRLGMGQAPDGSPRCSHALLTDTGIDGMGTSWGEPAVPPTEGLGSGRRFGHLFKSPLWGDVIPYNSPGMMTKGISEAFEVFPWILLGERIFLNCEWWGLFFFFYLVWGDGSGLARCHPSLHPAPAAGRSGPSRMLSVDRTGWTGAPGQGDCRQLTVPRAPWPCRGLCLMSPGMEGLWGTHRQSQHSRGTLHGRGHTHHPPHHRVTAETPHGDVVMETVISCNSSD